MEVEYNEGPEDEEAEHPDRRIIVRFFDELSEGNPSGAAKHLRALHATGGLLIRTDLELLADLLDGTVSDVFPWRLEFAKRGRGRPRHLLQKDLPAPWNAFASGDKVKSSKALRELEALGGTDLKILAGLLDNDPELRKRFPSLLVLKLPRRGKPSTLMTQAGHFSIDRMVSEARTRHKQMKGAVGEVCDRTGLSRSTVYEAMKAMRRKSRFT